MKLVSIILGVTLGTVFLVVADEPKPAPRPTAPSTDQKEKPRILTLETPAAPGTAKKPDLFVPNSTLQFVPAGPNIITPALPPGTTITPGPVENTGPAIIVNDNRAPLAPGIYVASPYSGIVVVPAPMDTGVFRPEPPNASKMPTAAPELRLTPKTK